MSSETPRASAEKGSSMVRLELSDREAAVTVAALGRVVENVEARQDIREVAAIVRREIVEAMGFAPAQTPASA